MEQVKVLPTKSNLARVKEQLAVAQNGHDLLRQKCDIFLMELTTIAEKIKLLENRMAAQTRKAYIELKKLLLICGNEKVEQIGKSTYYDFSFDEKEISIAGIVFTRLETILPQQKVFSSVISETAQSSAAATEFFKLLSLLAEIASVRTIAWRLANEVKKTQHRVNALEKIVIPQNNEAKKFIENTLEELERENIFTLKALKRKKA